MGRVEQALKRAGQPTMLAPVRQRPEPLGAPTDPFSLDLYPDELHAPVAPAPMTSAADSMIATPEIIDGDFAPRFSDAYKDKVITSAKLPPATVEQYRRLAASLHRLQTEQGLRSLTVTSSVPQEGKTLTIVNLAMTLSESYKRRVLLVDADLRRPCIHEVFGVAAGRGLCEALRSAPGDIVPLVHASPRLSVLPAGSPKGDPMTALASPRMAELLEEAAADFDWVLLDAPPVALMADAGLLVRLTRAVLLVIGAGSTPYTVVQRVVTEVGRENIVGTVLNRAEAVPGDLSPYY
jgi:capsular exopolysaccharide synthesis family protein